MMIPVDHFSMGDRFYNMLIDPVCKKFELTRMEFTVLIFLANNPQYDTASEILKIRRLTKSHVSVSIRSLEEKGLLICEHRGNDRRTVHLSLTKLADPVILDGRMAQEIFFSEIFRDFTEEEKNQLEEFIQRIDINIRRGIKEQEEI